LAPYGVGMQIRKGIPVTTDSRALPRLAELVAAARDRRQSPSAMREAVARRVRFLRAAAATQTERIQLLVAFRNRDREPVRDDIRAMAHVLRVRSRLTSDEQRSFDQLVIDYTETMLGMLIDRSDDEALEAVRRHLASVAHTMPACPRD
jgi:hypothetical protein